MTGQEKQPHDDIKRTLSLVAKVTLELAGLVQLVTWLVLTDGKSSIKGLVYV